MVEQNCSSPRYAYLSPSPSPPSTPILLVFHIVALVTLGLFVGVHGEKWETKRMRRRTPSVVLL
jgi:hypothetical protein